MKDFLKGERVSLEAFRPEDAEVFAAFEQDSEYLRMFDADIARPHTADEIRGSFGERKPPNDFVFSVHGPDGAVIGHGALDGILPYQGVGGMAVGFGRPYWGQGYGPETVRLLLRFAFGELNLRRVTVTVFSYNTRSIRLCERTGFVKEGAFRAFLLRDGQTYDMLLYGMLRDEFVDD